MQGLQILAFVMGPPGRLSVTGNEGVLVRPHRRNKSLKAAREQARVDPVHQIAQPPGAGHTMIKVTEPAQEFRVVLASEHDRLEIVAAGDRGAGDQQQHFLQGIGHPPTLTVIIDLRKMLQQHGQSGRCEGRFGSLVRHVRLQRIRNPPNHSPPVKPKSPVT